MPTIAIDKADLWERLGQEYSSEEFDHLLFEYGLELDDDTTSEITDELKKVFPSHSPVALADINELVEKAKTEKNVEIDRPQLKIEIPANRYDLLCIEGLSRALRVFLQTTATEVPQYKLVLPPGGESDLLTVSIHPDTSKIRPYFACAILRNVKFTPRSYASFIDLQDKLHHNICRRRQFVAIGTHDLDTLEPPFRYEARAPTDIKFVPLNKNKAYTAEELMTVYESDRQLSKFLHIIRDSPVYPIIYDAQDRVLSMPPIINSEHSKITLNTRNVFIDVTATDETKLAIVVNIVATMFSEYCEKPYTIEPVRVIQADGSTKITPDISCRQTTAHASYINSCTGLNLTAPQVSGLLQKMSISTTLSPSNADEILVEIPPTRPDILHECDIMEDAAIAYGFNNLPFSFPPTATVGQPLAIGQLSDVVRKEWALAGWIEVLPLILCSHEENFAWLNHEDDNTTAVKIANPKTLEFQIVRTTLLPGLLKTIRENRSHALPIKVFETSDIVVKDLKRERQARNVRHAAAVWCNKTAGFEVVHGMLDRAMKMLDVPRITSADHEATTGYYIKEVSDPMYFPGRAAEVYYRPPAKKKSLVQSIERRIESALKIETDIKIGSLGILHPSVLEKFDISYPCSALEFTLEPFKKQMPKMWTNEE
ncbi:Phenylalanyl-tRNA synthetase subunit beta [Mycena indigotica]|uniref:phenylalanine--tRNA ligase n=1 Tax=Mycena indigotica TaxID=2126181 RepID=A0A8H6W4T6_9AGAR|nr:Phenylalanyl-tRNA synthetase subunit beta [Mycena indigotica]KAF7301803.1 Phenylalanyl-tRNA synthetase subunit beta [Mycena indigotica]